MSNSVNTPITPENEIVKPKFDSSGFAEEADMDIDIRGLLLMLWRRKVIVLSIMIIGLSLVTIFISFVQSMYTARTIVLIEVSTQQKNTPEIQALMRTIRFDTSLILSEIEVIKSRNMARQVVERLGLVSDSEFNPRFSNLDAGDEGFKTLSINGSDIESVGDDVLAAQTEDVISRFLKNLNVFMIGNSNAIQIEYVSHDPIKAARIANTVADIYIQQRLDAKFQASRKVTSWLDKRLSDLREQVRVAEQAVADYKAEFNITEGARTITSAEQLSQLNSQLVTAKSKLAEAQARLDQVEQASRNGQDIESVSEIVNSSLIQQLKRQQATLDGRLSDLSTRYGLRHPQIIQITSEIDELDDTIRSEMRKIADTIENEVKFAEARVEALSEGLSESQGQRHEDNDAMIRLRELEREAASTRLIFDTFLQTYKRSDEQEELQEPDARIISYASVPQVPSYPNKPLFMSLSAAIALFIGLAVAVLLEKLDNSFRSANQLERLLKYPCFALIPSIESKSQRELVDYIVSKPSSTLAESVRTLRTVLNLRKHNEEEKPKVVTVTSSFPGEGKTTLSVWLGRLTAKSDEKVIIIDADLRRPNIHRSVGLSNDVTLVDYLTGQKELEDVIHKDDSSGVHMIFGRSVPNSALDLVSSKKMAQLIESLKQVYDLVIIDSPACLAVSDSRVLATLSDQTLYAVAWDRTPREVVMSGVKQFSDMEYEDLAFVLTNVDVKRHVRYGYGDTVYYYGRYKEYYAD